MSKHQGFVGQLALVTGGTGGIGRATCDALAAEGCHIAIHYHRAAEVAKDLTSQLATNHSIQAQAFQADLSNYDEVRRLHSEVTQAMGSPTILFNNAGTNMGKTGLKGISEIDVEEFEMTWRTNCGQAFLLTQLCMPAMVEKSWGRIVFCSSVAGFTGGVVGPHYASSKSALHGMIHWLASAYAQQNITVNGIAPALIASTNMVPGPNGVLEKKIPIGRLGQPKEIADTVLWMVKNAYVTNKVICVDGGMFIQ